MSPGTVAPLRLVLPKSRHQLRKRPDAADLPVTAISLPHTDHAFDVIGTT